jgi:hypothetical protein
VTDGTRLTLPPRWWIFILLPLATFTVVNLLLTQWGSAQFAIAQPFRVDGHIEAAGRLKTFATFLVYSALAIAATVYALLVFLALDSRGRRRIGLAYLATMAVGISTVMYVEVIKGDLYLEDRFACASFNQLHPFGPPVEATAEEAAKEPPPPRVPMGQLTCPTPGVGLFAIPATRPDGNNYFRQLRILFVLAALLLFVATPAIVWGAIAALALPAEGTAKERYAAWCAQTERLNRLLYITAAFLIAGLFFTSARINWPGYSLHPADLKSYHEHVRSFVLYLGVLNSVLIASFYLPVAAALAARRPPLPGAGWRPGRVREAGGGEEAKPDPWTAYKTALTILSPAILGLLAELLKFTP